MIIVEPINVGEVPFSRYSVGTYWDRNGVMQSAPAHALRVTYDPENLSAAPYALIEPESINGFVGSDSLNVGWGNNGGAIQDGVSIAPTGLTGASRWNLSSAGQGRFFYVPLPITGQVYTVSIFYRYISGSGRLVFGAEGIGNGYFHAATGAVYTSDGSSSLVESRRMANGWCRLKVSFTAISDNPLAVVFYASDAGAGAGDLGVVDNLLLDVFGAQFETGYTATSYISSGDQAARRDADYFLPTAAGLVYSNVPVLEQVYSANGTYSKGQQVLDPAAHYIYESLIDNNWNKELSDTSAWTPRGATNRWAMFDQYNNTQTTSRDEIIAVLAPNTIAQGLYVGNVYGDEVRISVTDPIEGKVYGENRSLIVTTSQSSFYNWFFKRLQRQDYYGTTALPPYAKGLVTITIRKIGGAAKCGMCAIGPVDEFGPSLLGLSTEGKDYSTTTFNFDGTSSTILRPYAKRMNCDMLVDNEQIDYIQTRLFAVRQKLIIWFGGPYGSTVVAGRYENFKNVISYPRHSQMNLTIGGSV